MNLWCKGVNRRNRAGIKFWWAVSCLKQVGYRFGGLLDMQLCGYWELDEYREDAKKEY